MEVHDCRSAVQWAMRNCGPSLSYDVLDLCALCKDPSPCVMHCSAVVWGQPGKQHWFCFSCAFSTPPDANSYGCAGFTHSINIWVCEYLLPGCFMHWASSSGQRRQKCLPGAGAMAQEIKSPMSRHEDLRLDPRHLLKSHVSVPLTLQAERWVPQSLLTSQPS